MKITLLGTGVAIPQHERVQSGLIIDGGGGPVLFDCGCGVLHRIYQSGYRHTDILNVFLSHLHLDHCCDFLPLVKANWLCDISHINLFGPTGTNQWLNDILTAYSYMQDKVDIRVSEISPGQVVNLARLRIECIGTVHALPSLGFKVRSNGSSVLYSGDTEPVTNVADASDGIDLLIHECSFPDTSDVTNHTTPKRLAEMLKGISIGRIILTHMYPQTKGFEAGIIAVISGICQCPVDIGYDLQVINLF